MDNLFEKITLYDILAYAFSGFIFLLITGYGKWKSLPLPGGTEEEQKLPIFCIVLLSYFMGILLSELSSMVMRILCIVLKSRSYDRLRSLLPFRGRVNHRRGKSENIGVFGSGVPEETVIGALIKAKVEKSPERIKEKGIEKYVSYMYGIIQVSPEYKRIHNYASAFVLYKNLSAAVCAGGFILFLNGRFTWREALAAVVALVLLLRRTIRLNKKKIKYTVIWFVDTFEKNKG